MIHRRRWWTVASQRSRHPASIAALLDQKREDAALLNEQKDVARKVCTRVQLRLEYIYLTPLQKEKKDTKERSAIRQN